MCSTRLAFAVAVLLAACSNAGVAHHLYSPCTTDADCPSSDRCVEGIDGGRLCSVECDGTIATDCSLSASPTALCMVRPGNPIGVCLVECPSRSEAGAHGCLAAYGSGAHEYDPGLTPSCVCTE